METERFRTEGPVYRLFEPSACSGVESAQAELVPLVAEHEKLRKRRPQQLQSTGFESGYWSESNGSEAYLWSPEESSPNQPEPRCTGLSIPFSSCSALDYGIRSPISAQGNRSPVAATSIPIATRDGPFFTKRTHSNVAFSHDDDDDGDDVDRLDSTRPPTAATIVSTFDATPEVGKEREVYTRMEIEAAQTLVAFSVADSAQPRTKKTRRG